MGFGGLLQDRHDAVVGRVDAAELHRVARTAATQEPGPLRGLGKGLETRHLDLLVGEAFRVEPHEFAPVGIHYVELRVYDLLVARGDELVVLGQRPSLEVVDQRHLADTALVLAYGQELVALAQPAACGAAVALAGGGTARGEGVVGGAVGVEPDGVALRRDEQHPKFICK